MKSTRRKFLTAATLGAAMTAVPASLRAAVSSPRAVSSSGMVEKDRLFAIAEAELQRNASRIMFTDRVGIADYSTYSSSPRFYLLDRENGLVLDYLVTHGRGSDPHHLGRLQSFSNVPGSNATSRGAYVTQEQYEGMHGSAMRLGGLDLDNYHARDRAIVVHSAWYAEPDMIAKYGKLGRSEGCFAFPSHQLGTIMDRLGPGRLLFADKLDDYRLAGTNAASDGASPGAPAHDEGAETLWPSTTFAKWD